MIKFLLPLFLFSSIFSSDRDSYDFVEKDDAVVMLKRFKFPTTVSQVASAIDQIEVDHGDAARIVRESQIVPKVDQKIVHSPLRARRLSLLVLQHVKAGQDPLSQSSPSIAITAYYPDIDVTSNVPSELRERKPELERALIVRPVKPDDKKLQQTATCLTILRNLFCN